MVLFLRFFSIKPWEMDLLTYDEFCDLERVAVEMNKPGRRDG